MIWSGWLALLVSFVVAFIALPVMIPRLGRVGLVGQDMQKPGRPRIPEMGGLALVTGFGAALLVAIALKTFFHLLPRVDLVGLLAVLATVLLIALVGILDDLIAVRQIVKAVTPLFAALPLVAIRSGYTVLNLPFVGYVNFGLLYPLVFVPLGVTGAANAMNMLAGFNGVEVGMGAVAFLALTVIALSLGKLTAALILLAALGAALACLYYNWYPARIFIGDVGTLSMGAVLASAVILGNFETAGVILVIPHLFDLVLKAAHGFPKSFGICHRGKLYCPESGPVGLGQLIMKLSGGISERNLTLVLIGLEVLMGLIAVWLYARF
ncbi:MAG TPA: UDP-N-acetylglucosamine--dolichyl-phosphate N-acetylglucosaminephosphotransferase [Candidatus Fraserbacteria bacterium]|mgnify:CR=1 FL=1|nr:UDP-N-acetylglucosamine--dolichyl-phosphate N-acetylglucosaminephosphotransferase [Candidatus Fraserbacteria bacterium]